MRMIVAALATLSLAACASTPDLPAGPPSLVEGMGSAPPAQARFYSACVVYAASQGTVDRVGNTLRYRCGGAAAQAFYEGLGAFSAEIGSEYQGEGRTYRVTQKIQHDLSGVDFCFRDAAGVYGCTIVLNVGPYLAK